MWHTHKQIYDLQCLEKNNQCSIPIDMLINRKSLWGEKKLVLSQNKRSHNLETFERNHKKFGTQSGNSLLINCEKVCSLSPKKWRSSWQESSSEITQICYQKISLINITRYY